MTFDDDFIAINFDGGTKRYTCHSAGIDWPPPEKLEIMGFSLERHRYSAITDEQRGKMSHICRGAEYLPVSTNESTD